MNMTRRTLLGGALAAGALPAFNIGAAGFGQGRARQIAKGAKIRDSSLPWEEACKDGPFTFRFTCPDGTASVKIMIYDSYVTKIDFRKEK